MHIVGGIGVGLLISALIQSFRPNMRWKPIVIVWGALLFGIIWEVFETRYDLTGYRVGTSLYYFDTFKDLLNDIIGGGIIAFILARKKHELPN
jgi:hypothetical protein